MSKATRATKMLEQAGVAFTVHDYDYEEQAMAHAFVFINGGQRGLQVRLSPRDAGALPTAVAAPLVA